MKLIVPEVDRKIRTYHFMSTAEVGIIQIVHKRVIPRATKNTILTSLARNHIPLSITTLN